MSEMFKPAKENCPVGKLRSARPHRVPILRGYWAILRHPIPGAPSPACKTDGQRRIERPRSTPVWPPDTILVTAKDRTRPQHTDVYLYGSRVRVAVSAHLKMSVSCPAPVGIDRRPEPTSLEQSKPHRSASSQCFPTDARRLCRWPTSMRRHHPANSPQSRTVDWSFYSSTDRP